MPKSSSAIRAPSARSCSSTRTAPPSSTSSVSVISSVRSCALTPAASSAALHLARQLGRELARRQVHRHADPGGRERLQLRQPAAGLVQHPAPDGHDQVGLLRHGDELGRRDEAALGMAPADERLERRAARLPPARQRLQVQLQLAVRDRAAQLVLDGEAPEDAGAQLRVEDLVAAAAALLGAVHRHVRVTQQRVGVRMARVGHDDPDAGADEQLAPGDDDRPLELRRSGARRARRPRGRSWRGRRRPRTRRRRSARRRRRRGRRRADAGATTRSSSSPAPWPSVSLTTLKRSRSISSSATCSPSRAAAASDCGMCASRKARFARPVSGSCSARERTSASACARSSAEASTFATASTKRTSSGPNSGAARSGAA